MDKETAIARAKELNETFTRGSFVAHEFEGGTCVYRVKQFFVSFLSNDDCTINCDAEFGYNLGKKIKFGHTFGAENKVRFATANEISELLELYNQGNKKRLQDLVKSANEKFLPSEIMWVVYSLIKWESDNICKDNFLRYMDDNNLYSPTLENVVQYCKLHHFMDNFINYLFPSVTPLVHPIYHFMKEISWLMNKVQ